MIREHIEDFYKVIYKEKKRGRPKIDGVELASLEKGDKEWLERGFCEEQILNAIDSMEREKTLGPEGFKW